MLTVVVNGSNDSRAGVAIQITVSYIVFPVKLEGPAALDPGYQLLAVFIKKHRQFNGLVVSARSRSATIRGNTMR